MENCFASCLVRNIDATWPEELLDENTARFYEVSSPGMQYTSTVEQIVCVPRDCCVCERVGLPTAYQ